MYLRNPVSTLGSCISVLGETVVLAEMKDFADLVIGNSPYAPEFIAAVGNSPSIFASLFRRYLANASSSQFSTSNPLASAAPALDEPLAAVVTDEQAFEFLTAIAQGAEWGGNNAYALRNIAFRSLPKLRAKAHAFATVNSGASTAILGKYSLTCDFRTFVTSYLA